MSRAIDKTTRLCYIIATPLSRNILIRFLILHINLNFTMLGLIAQAASEQQDEVNISEFACAGSVKACYGHTEGAAGLQGGLCSILSLQMAAIPPIMHLRNINPYVSAAITEWKASSNLQAFIPRVSPTIKSIFTLSFFSE